MVSLPSLINVEVKLTTPKTGKQVFRRDFLFEGHFRGDGFVYSNLLPPQWTVCIQSLHKEKYQELLESFQCMDFTISTVPIHRNSSPD